MIDDALYLDDEGSLLQALLKAILPPTKATFTFELCILDAKESSSACNSSPTTVARSSNGSFEETLSTQTRKRRDQPGECGAFSISGQCRVRRRG